jgi:predicted DNA-binding transcriptional regulator AlpA
MLPEVVSADDLVTAGQVGAMLGVSRARVHQLAERPDFPPPIGRAGNYRLWNRLAIERWLASWDRTNVGGRPRKTP